MFTLFPPCLRAVIVGFAICGLSAMALAQEPEAAARQYLSANGLLNRGMYEMAADEYRAFLEEHPRNAKVNAARYGLAVCLYQMRNFEAAADALETLVKKMPDDFEYRVEALTMLAQCELAREDYDRARAVAKRVVQNDTKHKLADAAAGIWAEAASRAGETRELGRVARVFENQFADSPRRERVMYLHAAALAKAKDWNASAAAAESMLDANPRGDFAPQASLLLGQCRQTLGAHEAARDAFERVLASDVTVLHTDARLGLAICLRALGDARHAVNELQKVAKSELDEQTRARVQFELGCALADLDQVAAALDAFQAVAAGPDSVLAKDAAYRAANLQLRAGDAANAAVALDALASSDDAGERTPEMQYDLAVALFRSGDLARAETALAPFSRKLADHALAPPAQYLAALIVHQRGDYDASGKRCAALMRRGAGDLAADAAFLAAENLYLLQQYDDARDAFAKFLRQWPDVPRAATARLRLGLAQLQLGETQAASKSLVQALESLPPEQRGEALYSLGTIAFDASQWNLAAERLRDYLDAPQPARRASALLKLGIALQRGGDADGALAALAQCLKSDPADAIRAQATFERAQVLTALGRADDARAVYARVLAMDKDGSQRFAPHARLALANDAVARNDLTTARAQLDAVLEEQTDGAPIAETLLLRGQVLAAQTNPEGAAADFNAFLKRFGDHAAASEARARLGLALAAQDEFKSALKQLDRIPANDLAKLESALRDAVIFERGWCLARTGDDEAAAEQLRVLVISDTADPHANARVELARMAAARNDHNAVIEVLTPLRDRSELPDSRRQAALYKLGTSLFELEKWDDAVDVLNAALDVQGDPKLAASAQYFCGEAEYRRGALARAVSHFEQVVGSPAAGDALAPSLLRLGEINAALQRWKRSEEAYDGFLGQFADAPQWPQARFGVGWARENQGRLPEALTAYREVVERHTGETAARAQFQIGECLFAQGELDAAVKELLKVEILYAYDEWSAAGLFEAGRCLQRLGKPVESRRQFEAVVAKYASTKWGPLAAKRLESRDTGLPGRSEGVRGAVQDTNRQDNAGS